MNLASIIVTILFIGLASADLETFEDTQTCFLWSSYIDEDWEGATSISVLPVDYGTFQQTGENSLGTWCFTPDEDEFGEYMVNVQVCWGIEGCDAYGVDVYIMPVNDAPVAFDDYATMLADDLCVEVDVVSNDEDIDSPVDYRTVSLLNAFGSGVEVTPEGKIKWTRSSRQVGTDNTVEYQICDPYPPYACASAVVYFTSAAGCDACQDCKEYFTSHAYHTETVEEIWHEVTSM